MADSIYIRCFSLYLALLFIEYSNLKMNTLQGMKTNTLNYYYLQYILSFCMKKAKKCRQTANEVVKCTQTKTISHKIHICKQNVVFCQAYTSHQQVDPAPINLFCLGNILQHRWLHSTYEALYREWFLAVPFLSLVHFMLKSLLADPSKLNDCTVIQIRIYDEDSTLFEGCGRVSEIHLISVTNKPRISLYVNPWGGGELNRINKAIILIYQIYLHETSIYLHQFGLPLWSNYLLICSFLGSSRSLVVQLRQIRQYFLSFIAWCLVGKKTIGNYEATFANLNGGLLVTSPCRSIN